MELGSEQHSRAIWTKLFETVGAEPREDLTIRGVSGIEHSVQAIGVDDKNRRLVIVAAEQDPRIAALMQGDIQARMPNLRVLVARPIAFDMPSFARSFIGQLGQAELNVKEFNETIQKFKAEDGTYPGLQEVIMPLIGPTILAFQKVKLPPLPQLFGIVQQIVMLDWESAFQKQQENPSNFAIPLNDLIKLDGMVLDRKLGVCPIPLYELTEQDWELFTSARNLEAVRERLKALGIYQYFFPAPDQIALGVAERTQASIRDVEEVIKLAPKEGHPLGSSEIVTACSIPGIIEQLIDKGLLVEGELNLSVTESGKTARTKVKFKPREGVLSKLLGRLRLSAHFSAKDFF